MEKQNNERAIYACPKCGGEVEESIKFCVKCGAKVRWIQPMRTCSHCKNEWRPRKANPKNCPACGFQLSKDNLVYIELKVEVSDEGAHGMSEAKCSVCGKWTRNFANYRTEPSEKFRPVCYICLADYFTRKGEGEDIVEGSFATKGIGKQEDGSDVLIQE